MPSLTRLVCVLVKIHVYMAKFSTVCPYSGDARRVSYYFRQAANDTQPPDDPQCALDVFDKHLEITHKQIENMQKIIKSHRAALDFDRGFITSALKLAKNLDLKEEIEIGPRQKKRGRKRRRQ